MKRLLNEPVAIAATIQSVIGFAIIMGWLNMTEVQTGAMMVAVNAVLGLFVRQVVTPNQLAEARVSVGGSPTQPMTEAQKEVHEANLEREKQSK
jgi:hypothetical protein